jgi:hypothetical protein
MLSYYDIRIYISYVARSLPSVLENSFRVACTLQTVKYYPWKDAFVIMLFFIVFI